MDLYLVAAVTFEGVLTIAWLILKVAFGLGAVIFVHELGHFLVAKACGVKCEKFYVGFDIPISIGRFRLPQRLLRWKWGETEYGIGNLPLGGYVKMLGQDDNPANAQKEADRIKVRRAAAAESAPAANAEAAADHADDACELDPRSYPAKPVPLRMMIISAGVVMNLAFAVVFATFAFKAGVPYTPCEIGGAIPGSPAWRAGLEPGSRIVQLGENGRVSEHLRFDWDLRNAVGLANNKQDLALLVRNADGSQRRVSVRPMMTRVDGRELPMLGIEPAATTQLSTRRPAVPGYPAGQAEPKLAAGDRVLAVDGQSVSDGYALMRLLSANVREPLRLTIERQGKGRQDGAGSTIEVTVPPNHVKRLGLVMAAGAISGVRSNSPASRAGLQEGDVIVSINGEPPGDPLTLASRLQPFYGREVEMVVSRTEAPGQSREVHLRVTPEPPSSFENVFTVGSPGGVKSLGVVFPVLPRVVSVTPGSPAEQAGLGAGDEIVAVTFVSQDPKRKPRDLINEGRSLELNADTFTWPFIYDRMQSLEDDDQMVLTYRRNGQTAQAQLKPMVTDEYYADRGLVFTSLSETHYADSWVDAVALGFRQTGQDMTKVLDFLNELFTGGVSPMHLGGPISIARVAGSEASQGLSRLLIFLTFLSANLAILNFLPIPALDGGHMVFLLAEGIRGKPIDERMQIALTIAGVACLLGLMVFVFALDIGRFLL